MDIVHTDVVIDVPPGTTPDYARNNPLLKLLRLVEGVRLAAPREAYSAGELQYLVPFADLVMYGPAGDQHAVLDPAKQDDKTDFQKQNVDDFHTTDTLVVRGLARAGDWVGPFLRLSYRGGPDSLLSQRAQHQLGARIKLWLRVNQTAAPEPIAVPYNPATDRYEVELWGYGGGDLGARLGPRGADAIARGELLQRPDLVQGQASDFAREGMDGRYAVEVAPANVMHPVLPLSLETAWSDDAGQVWDSRDGANYRYQFNMILRGWDHYLGVGMSANPHGGVGFLEYRNLLSNYGRYAGSHELQRVLRPWNFDAFGHKGHDGDVEPFMAVDYMDLHIVLPGCGIGLHRHRDNQEVFLMMAGRGYMVVGDWCQMDSRVRCMEIRTLRAGHLAMLKGGNLHALMNPSTEPLSLFMFGGYD